VASFRVGVVGPRAANLRAARAVIEAQWTEIGPKAIATMLSGMRDGAGDGAGRVGPRLAAPEPAAPAPAAPPSAAPAPTKPAAPAPAAPAAPPPAAPAPTKPAAPAAAQPVTSTAPVNISVIAWNSGTSAEAFKNAMQQINDKYKQKKSNVTVAFEALGQGANWTNAQKARIAGQTVDVTATYGFAPVDIINFQPDKQFLDLTDLSTIKNFDKSSIARFMTWRARSGR
jgi:hypothetical protein